MLWVKDHGSPSDPSLPHVFTHADEHVSLLHAAASAADDGEGGSPMDGDGGGLVHKR